MIEEADDFLNESAALYDLLNPLSNDEYNQSTQFKEWTINDVMQHLHCFNLAAAYSLLDPERFDSLISDIFERQKKGASFVEATNAFLNNLNGKELLCEWKEGFESTADAFRSANPQQRLAWVGPNMSARSSISARLMETWAHGQEIYDKLGVIRQNTDRIRSIAVLGVNTYNWTFKNRGEEAPKPEPYIRLTAPSGAVWEWNEVSQEHFIKGSAEEFCQVVTQVRNIGDTKLHAEGAPAIRWMAVAQCFAGPAESPPQVGTRGPKS